MQPQLIVFAFEFVPLFVTTFLCFLNLGRSIFLRAIRYLFLRQARRSSSHSPASGKPARWRPSRAKHNQSQNHCRCQHHRHSQNDLKRSRECSQQASHPAAVGHLCLGIYALVILLHRLACRGSGRSVGGRSGARTSLTVQTLLCTFPAAASFCERSIIYRSPRSLQRS